MEKLILGLIGIIAVGYLIQFAVKSSQGKEVCQCSSANSCAGKCCSQATKKG